MQLTTKSLDPNKLPDIPDTDSVTLPNQAEDRQGISWLELSNWKDSKF